MRRWLGNGGWAEPGSNALRCVAMLRNVEQNSCDALRISCCLRNLASDSCCQFWRQEQMESRVAKSCQLGRGLRCSVPCPQDMKLHQGFTPVSGSSLQPSKQKNDGATAAEPRGTQPPSAPAYPCSQIQASNKSPGVYLGTRYGKRDADPGWSKRLENNLLHHLCGGLWSMAATLLKILLI